MVTNPVQLAELAIEKQAQTLLMPVSARRQLNARQSSDRLRRRKRHPTASQSDAPIPVARVGPSEEAPFPDVIGAALDAFTGERFTDFPHLLLPPCFPEPTRGLRSTRASGQLTGFTEQFGAGEGIRTLDPDLGKVVLYP